MKSGIFVSNWTSEGDLYGAIALYNPLILFYRVGLFVGTRFVFDNNLRLPLDKIYSVPVFILQNGGDDELLYYLINELYEGYEGHIAIDVEIDTPNLVKRLQGLVSTIHNETLATPLIYTNLDFISRYRLRNFDLIYNTPLWLAYYGSNLPSLDWGGKIVVWQRKPKINYYKNQVLNVTYEVIVRPEHFGI